MNEFDKNLVRAKFSIMSNKKFVFFSNLMMLLKHSEDESIPTACTDGRSIRYNPSWFNKLSKEERVFLVLHEVMHVALDHVQRIGTKDRMLYNVAGDFIINDFLKDAGIELIKGSLHSARYTHHRWTTEQVYEDLKRNQPDLGNSELLGDVQPSEESSESPTEVGELLVRAYQMSQDAGDSSLPLELADWFNELSKPKVNWKVLLAKYLEQINRSRYEWRRPNRKLYPQFYLPTLLGRGLGNVDIAIDVSGSITKEVFNNFISEVSVILSKHKPAKINCIQWDTEVLGTDTVHSLQELKQVTMHSGGGTDPTAMLKLSNTNDSKVLIVLTDGYFHEKDLPKVNKEILWILFDNQYDDFEPTQGKVVRINT